MKSQAGILRRKLAVLKHKCDEIIRVNKKNREEIDEKRKERVVFDRIYKDMEVNYVSARNNFQKQLLKQDEIIKERDLTFN